MRFETIRFLLAYVVLHVWEINQVDVKTAFLYGELDEEIFMDLPTLPQASNGWVAYPMCEKQRSSPENDESSKKYLLN